MNVINIINSPYSSLTFFYLNNKQIKIIKKARIITSRLCCVYP